MNSAQKMGLEKVTFNVEVNIWSFSENIWELGADFDIVSEDSEFIS